jgi:hypothetical protein
MTGASTISARLALCLLAASAAGCGSAQTWTPTADQPHEFHASHAVSVKNDGGVRPDYVVVRVTEGAPHAPGGRPQPVLETRLLVAAGEDATTIGGLGNYTTIVPRTKDSQGRIADSTVVADRVDACPEVWAVDLPKVYWPAGHDDAAVVPGASLPAKFAADAGRPFDYCADYDVDRVGRDEVALTFGFATRSENVLVREVPATTIHLRYGQSVVFATRRPQSGTK